MPEPRASTGWATGISSGPMETGQGLTFDVSTDRPGLFAVQPVVDAATGRLSYTPAPDANGTATVTVALRDDGGGADVSPPQTFSITVTAVADPPVARDDSYSVGLFSGAVQLDVLDNDESESGIDLTTLTVSSSPSKGTASVDTATGLITYDPDFLAFGSDTFEYSWESLGSGIQVTARVTVDFFL